MFYVVVYVAHLVGWWQMSTDINVTIQLHVSMEIVIEILFKWRVLWKMMKTWCSYNFMSRNLRTERRCHSLISRCVFICVCLRWCVWRETSDSQPKAWDYKILKHWMSQELIYYQFFFSVLVLWCFISLDAQLFCTCVCELDGGFCIAWPMNRQLVRSLQNTTVNCVL